MFPGLRLARSHSFLIDEVGTDGYMVTIQSCRIHLAIDPVS